MWRRSDIWTVPPWDDGTIRRALRRRTRRTFYAGAAAFLIAVSSVTYAAMNESTAVSGRDVLADFRAARASGAGDGSAPASDAARKAARSRPPKRVTRPSAGDPASASPSRSRATAAAIPPDEASPSLGAGGGGQRREAASQTAATPKAGSSLPEEGVYTWSVEGFERAPGVQRDLPEEAHRTLMHSDERGRWVEHMIFSEQKEMWFDLSVVESGVVTNSSRNKVSIGPMTQDRTVVFEPPVLVSNWPFRVGETWSGDWEGKTYGRYSGRTSERTFVTIEGERVETYISEVVMELRGEIEGTVLTRSWVSPRYNMVVRQYMETDVQSGPGSYYSEWTGQVRSLDPRS